MRLGSWQPEKVCPTKLLVCELTTALTVVLAGVLFCLDIFHTEQNMDNVLMGLPSRNHADPTVMGLDRVKEHNVPAFQAFTYPCLVQSH